jgi:hypothetical protein
MVAEKGCYFQQFHLLRHKKGDSHLLMKRKGDSPRAVPLTLTLS